MARIPNVIRQLFLASREQMELIIKLSLKCMMQSTQGEKLVNFTKEMLAVYSSEAPKIIKAFPHLAKYLLFKSVRLLAIFSYDSSIRRSIESIISTVWKEGKSDCLLLGRDLMFALEAVPISGMEAVMKIKEELGKTAPNSLVSLSHSLYENQALMRTPLERDRLHEVLSLSFSPQVHEMINFIFATVQASNMKCVSWLLTRLGIKKTTDYAPLVVDFIRYVVACPEQTRNFGCNGSVQRLAVIGYCLKILTDPLLKTSIKKALIYDYLFFQPEYPFPFSCGFSKAMRQRGESRK